MSTSDRYAHLRVNLETFRTMTAHGSAVLWCSGCELHLADADGLCPLCRPASAALEPAALDPAADEPAA